MARDQTEYMGWAWEGTDGTDPITPASTGLYWTFGYRTKDMKDDHPVMIQNWLPIYKDSIKNPSDAELTGYTVNAQFGFYPTNGTSLYKILGSASSAAGVHTIDNINTTTLPTFTVRSETFTDATNFKGMAATGCKAAGLSGHINCLSDFKFLSEIININGRLYGTPTLNETHVVGPYHATSDYTMTAGNQQKGRYGVDSNFVFSWNSNNLKDDLGQFKYDIINTQDLFQPENQAYVEYIDEGNYQFLVNFSLWRGNANTDAVFTDYKAGTQRNIVFTIYNGAAIYRTLTFTNVSLGLCKATNVIKGNGERLWLCHGFAEDVQASVKDGVSTSFYGL